VSESTPDKVQEEEEQTLDPEQLAAAIFSDGDEEETVDLPVGPMEEGLDGAPPRRKKIPTPVTRVRRAEYFQISRRLETHHILFDKFWQLGKIVFHKEIPTACVIFSRVHDQRRPIAMAFNPKFWAELTVEQRCIVIAHECLHICLNHGIRLKDATSKQAANVAADLVINHLLVNRFGFNRDDFPAEASIAWVDSVFHSVGHVAPGETYEYYYTLLMDMAAQQLAQIAASLGFPDDHSTMIDDDGGENTRGQQKIIDELDDTLSEFEKETLRETIKKHWQKKRERDDEGQKTSSSKPGGQEAGDTPGGIWTFAKDEKPQAKRKWETVIKLWSKKYLKTDMRPADQWARTNRRFAFVSKKLLIPTSMETETDEEKKEKILVWFFQDTSGSCAHLKDRFFKAAETLPKRRFDVKMHCFDTQVYEVDMEERKLQGFGGTSFDCLEKYVQNYCATNGVPYPEAVWVVTDGYGDEVNPQVPEKWFWFLTEDGSEAYIPETSHKFFLKDFE